VSFFDGKHAVVTGGGSGIGAAIARSLANAGAAVTIMGRNEEQLAVVADEISAARQVVDVTDRDQVATAFGNAVAENGDVDILVNNAGAAEAMPFAKMQDEMWDQMIAVNLTGVYNCTRAVINPMLAAGAGRVVNIASTAALTGYAYIAAYNAAKHGVLGLTRSLALEYAKKGITVNAVCPGYTNTQMVAKALDKIAASTGRTREQALAEITQSNPQGRLIEPEEVAESVIWLCQQESVTGQAIAIAGGEVL
jgi:NAD(P)-dependent dehydrogenase (short-subunit alcohol dehydrogenase family)